MKKMKLLLIGCILIFTLALGGCIRVETAFVVDESSSLTMNMKYAFNKEKANAALEEMAKETGETIRPEEIFADFTEETIHGEQYYVNSSSQTYTQKELQEDGFPALVNKDKFYLYAAADMEDDIGDFSDIEQELESMGLSLEDIEYLSFSVNLPSSIVKTNGVLQEDQTTVVWDYTDALTQEKQEYEFYAYTANVPADPDADRQTILAMLNPVPTGNPLPSNTPIVPTNTPLPTTPGINPVPSTDAPGIDDTTDSKDTKAPVIKGIKKNKSYKKKVTVYVKDNKELKKVTVNGKKAKLTKVKKGKYKGYFKFTVKKKGKKTIVAYDAAGNKKKISIKIK